MEKLFSIESLRHQVEIWQISKMARVVYVGDKIGSELVMELRVGKKSPVLAEIEALKIYRKIDIVFENGQENGQENRGVFLRVVGCDVDVCRLVVVDGENI